MSQFYVICFDIAEKKRLRKVSTQMENFGQRIQYSIFECYLNDKNLKILQGRLNSIINKAEDSIRYYPLCNKDYKKIPLKNKADITPNDNYHLI
ncbi:MAG: CRISPR-associated endonuclease Cas2 [Thiotrichaceae bacterium]|nr:CRISPR-associated endonuclease Cas2 [Thiotrichaceae bacterium]